uniref:hypothetical protein n=1 Tax=Enterobacter sp. TaxID=42895 RepID=UPI00296F6731|nr:hypothetical protein [Enterobacter sp.]
MDQVDFEAIGRCEHLKDGINDILKLRDMAASRISSATRQSGNNSIYGAIKEFNMAFIDSELENLKKTDAQLRKLITEYNSWAERAGKSPILFSKY